MPIAPWLVPTDVLGAIRSGSSVGLQVRQQAEAERQAQIANALAQQQAEAANAQAAERLRLAHEQLFQQAQQEQAANQLKADAFAQEQAKFQYAQDRQQRMEEANKLFGSTLAKGLLTGTDQTPADYWQGTEGQGPPMGGTGPRDILGAFATAAGAAPGAEAVQKLDADALIKATQQNQNRGYAEAALIRLEQQSGVHIPRLPDGSPEPVAYQQAINKTSHLAELGKQTTIEKRADEFSSSVKRINPDISNDELKQEVDQFVSTNGQSALIPTAEMKIIAGGDVLAVGLQQALDSVKGFNDKFGKNAFDEFTGPINNRILNLKKKFGPKFTDEDAIAARKIFQSIDQVSQTYRNANFGSQLSGSEIKQFEKIIENPDSSSFIPALEGAVETTKKILSNKTELYPYALNPGMSKIRERYRPSSKRTEENKVGKYRIISVGQ